MRVRSRSIKVFSLEGPYGPFYAQGVGTYVLAVSEHDSQSRFKSRARTEILVNSAAKHMN